MKSAYDREEEKDTETKGDYMVTVEMTEKQAINLSLLAYQAGYDSTAGLLEAMIRDITGWGGETGAKDDIDDWYEKTHKSMRLKNYFRFYLYNYGYNMEHLHEMLSNQGQFEEDYQNYLDESDGMITESWERCLEVVKEIYEAGGYV